MKTAVIYCRYSSDSQTEQSIDGQLRVCTDYAKEPRYTHTWYLHRPCNDGYKRQSPRFNVWYETAQKERSVWCLCISLTAFRVYETAMHKKTLKDNGVKVVSATEFVPDTPEGIIFEVCSKAMQSIIAQNFRRKYGVAITKAVVKAILRAVKYLTAIRT